MSPLAKLPKVDIVLAEPGLDSSNWRASLAKRAVQLEIDAERKKVQDLLKRDDKAAEVIDVADAPRIAGRALLRLQAWVSPHPRPVLNATGVLLHTNLGRAPLGPEAIDAMCAAAGTCDLEVDVPSGLRGSRYRFIRELMSEVFEAEDAHVVGNGAAALLLSCTALGGDGVVISRGQMVEIGDGFRIADMAAAGGVKLIEIGSTNRTHAQDYKRALEEGAGAILWVHPSNFRQSGFTAEVDLPQLSELAKEFDVPLIADLGSGSLGVGLPEEEPTIQAYLSMGADIVTCSGDKLFGGPQAGLMAGRAAFVERCRRHPMARALRPDKTTIAAMHATLAAHARGGIPKLPLHQMLAVSNEDLRRRAKDILDALGGHDNGWGENHIVETQATVGGGSLPGSTFDSVGICVANESVQRVAKKLRLGTPSVFGRIGDERLVLDLRTVRAEDDTLLIEAIRAGVERPTAKPPTVEASPLS